MQSYSLPNSQKVIKQNKVLFRQKVKKKMQQNGLSQVKGYERKMEVPKKFETAHRQDSMLRRSLSNTDLQRRRTTMQLQGTIATMQKMLHN